MEARMWVPSVDVFELIFRGIVVYLVLFALLRFIGKKHVGELSPFDFVVLLITSGSPIRGKKKQGRTGNVYRDRVGPMPVSSHSTDTRQARQNGTIRLCGMSDAPRPSYLV